jgi:microcystin degradation protein MlrC
MMVSMGRYAVIRSRNLSVLVTEKPAPTFDPEAFRVAGIQLEELDVIVVRSALLFREAYRTIATRALVLDLPGPSTARLATLQYRRVPRPMFPLDGVA